MENYETKALTAIKEGLVLDLKQDKAVFVKQLEYWNDELMIVGYGENQYRAKDHEKTWILMEEKK